MLSKNQIKNITQFGLKKNRLKEGCFIAEGTKLINELLLSHIELYSIYTTESFNIDAKKQILINDKDLKRISFLKTPNKALAIFKIPKPKPIDYKGLIVVLDDVRDPGNLGTIIRLCDWFGITNLVCSKTTVDCYNPKVLQATMGSIARVNINYLNLDEFLNTSKIPVYGAFMDGENIYKLSLPEHGILIFGNEANGISPTLEHLIDKRISIPRFGNLQVTESLNVATATAILLSEFKRF